MSIQSQILKDYAQYLDARNIEYRTKNGFSVRFELTNVKVAFIDVREQNRKITLFDYFGTCYTGIRATNRVAKVLKAKFPEYTIWVEKFTAFEIDIEEEFQFTTIEELHQRVCKMAAVVDEGAGIGKEMLGEDFDR